MTDHWCRCGHHATKHVDGACTRCECQAFASPTRVEVDPDFEVPLGDIAYADQVVVKKLDGSNHWYAQNEIPAATCRRCHEQLYQTVAFGRMVWRHQGRCANSQPEDAYKVVVVNE